MSTESDVTGSDRGVGHWGSMACSFVFHFVAWVCAQRTSLLLSEGSRLGGGHMVGLAAGNLSAGTCLAPVTIESINELNKWHKLPPDKMKMFTNMRFWHLATPSGSIFNIIPKRLTDICRRHNRTHTHKQTHTHSAVIWSFLLQEAETSLESHHLQRNKPLD